MANWIRFMAAVLLGALAAGCTTVPASAKPPSAEAQTFLKYAGPPVDSFTYLGRYDGFRTLGGQYVAIWTTFKDAYLIKVMDPCVELPFANRVDLTSTSHTVTRNFDWLIVGRDRCRLQSIQPLDVEAMKQAHVVGP